MAGRITPSGEPRRLRLWLILGVYILPILFFWFLLRPGYSHHVRLGGGLLMLCWLFSQVLALPLLVHHRHRALQAMDHSRQLVRHNGLKVLALLGLLIGINLLGLIGASLVLLFSLPFSALILMACCRTQTPCRSVSRRNMLPT